MERFDLSYRSLDNREISLVVERLPLDPPAYQSAWERESEGDGQREMRMLYYLSSLPPGIPTWFIARQHRFTTHTHWRLGALLADSPEQRHLGLLQTYPHEQRLEMAVRGPAPHNFFTLLRDGLELTLERYPGLKVQRKIPCPGHGGHPCSHEFDFEHLQRAVERTPPVAEVQCPVSFESVSIPEMLYGRSLTIPLNS